MIPLVLIGAGLVAAGVRAELRRGSRIRGLAPDDIDALARVITSEAGSGSLAEKRAIGWTVRNRAAKARKSIAQLVCAPCGPQEPGRPFSSRQPATAEARRIAAEILAAPPGGDPTAGATAFFEPALQDKLAKAGGIRTPEGKVVKYTKDAKTIRAKWIAEGQRPRGSVGRFEFFA